MDSTHTTFIIPQFSYEDSVGPAKGKDNNYLGDWKNAGNGDTLDCYHDSLHYFYQVDSIFNKQFIKWESLNGAFGSINIAGSSGFKYDKRSIDTLLTKDTLLYFVNNCAGGTRIGNNAEHKADEKLKSPGEFIVFPNPFASDTRIIYNGEKKNISKVSITNILNQDLTKMFEINSIQYKGRTEVSIRKIIAMKGIYFCIFDLNNESQRAVKLIIE